MKNLPSLIILLVICFANLNAQDLIVRKDSTEIYCKIVYVNVRSLYYTVSNDPKEIKIDKSDVLKYEFDWHQLEKPRTANSPTSPATSTLSAASPTVVKGEFIKMFFSGGLSMPSGDFASADINNDKSGFATMGYAGQGGLGIKLNKYIRLMVSYFYQKNNFDGLTYDDALRKMYPSNNFSSISSAWVCNGLFGGFLFSIPLEAGNKLNAFVDVQAGKPKFVSPNIETKVSAYYMGATYGITSTIETANANALAYLIGLGLNYKLTEEVHLNFGIHVFSAKPVFLNVVSKSSNGYLSTDNLYQQINTNVFKLGLIFKLG